MDAFSIQDNIRDDRATVANDVNIVIVLPPEPKFGKFLQWK